MRYTPLITINSLDQEIPSIIRGSSRNKNIGICFTYSGSTEIRLDTLKISNVFMGLMKHGNGKVYIKTLEIFNFGGDAINIRGNNLTIENLIIHDAIPTLPYNFIKTTNPNNIVEIKKALYSCGENIATRFINDIDWRISTQNNQNELHNGKAVYISTENYHVDAGFQSFHHHNYHCQSTINVTINSFIIPSIQLDSIASYILSNLERSSKYEYFDIQNIVGFTLQPYIIEQIKNDKNIVEKLRIALPEGKDRLSLIVNIEERIFSIFINSRGNVSTTMAINSSARPCQEKSSNENFNGSIKNIIINNIDICITNPVTQIFILSESSNYSNFQVGNKSLKVSCVYPYWFVANTLQNSYIGNSNAKITCVNYGNRSLEYREVVNNDLFHYNSAGGTGCNSRYPKLRIGTGSNEIIPCLKETFNEESITKEVTLNGVGKINDLTNPHYPLVTSSKVLGQDRVSIQNSRDPSSNCPLTYFTNNRIELLEDITSNIRNGYIEEGDRDGEIRSNIHEVTQIAALQAFLNAIGYNAGVTDGIFGILTKTAVKAYQADHGLVSDGVIGSITQGAINSFCNN